MSVTRETEGRPALMAARSQSPPRPDIGVPDIRTPRYPAPVAGRAVPGGLQTVAAALDLLDCFAEEEELGVTDVSRRLGIPKANAHRLLTTLASRGIIEQNQRTAKYRLGLRLYELGNLALTRVVLRRHARAPLEALREAVGWTVQLSVVSGVDTLVLERLQTSRSLQSLPDFDHRLPLNVTAQGKAICAYDPDLARERIEAGLPRLTAHSITSSTAFRRELEKIRRAGFAVSAEEVVLGVTAVGVPVFDARGVPIAAVTVLGAPDQIGPGVPRIARLVEATARRISKGLKTELPG